MKKGLQKGITVKRCNNTLMAMWSYSRSMMDMEMLCDMLERWFEDNGVSVRLLNHMVAHTGFSWEGHPYCMFAVSLKRGKKRACVTIHWGDHGIVKVAWRGSLIPSLAELASIAEYPGVM